MSNGIKYLLKNPNLTNLKINEAQLKQILEAMCHPGWYKGPDELKDALIVSETNKNNVLIAFSDLANCDHCQLLKSQVFDSCDFGFWVTRKGLILVDIDNSNPTQEISDLFNTFTINGVPQVLILDPYGKERGRVRGYMGGSEAAWMKDISQYVP
jgi:thioredoxin-related protein